MAAFGESQRKLQRAVQERGLWEISEHDLSRVRRMRLHLTCKKLKRLTFDEPTRFALARALQEETERRIYRFMSPFLEGAKGVDVCLSGGVFLNCVATGKIERWFPQVRRVSIPPAPYDAGLSIGLAQNYLFDCGIDPCSAGARAPFSAGRSYSLQTVTAACRAAALDQPVTETPSQIAKRLGRGEIIGLFQGASESGRRALGNRSIVADPRDPAKRELLNKVIKKRQWFRPFAPMILEDEVVKWFEVPEGFESPYMSFAVPFRAGKAELVPAVCHNDGTARLQTVHADLTPITHQILKAWHEHSGVPILLNTSFNDSEPIVEKPDEAISTMIRAGIDGIYFAEFGAFVSNIKR
jgi:carbamoyltransferase